MKNLRIIVLNVIKIIQYYDCNLNNNEYLYNNNNYPNDYPFLIEVIHECVKNYPNNFDVNGNLFLI